MSFDPWELKEHRKYPRATSRPTNRQLQYIETLCDDLGLEHSNYIPGSFIEASEMINDLKLTINDLKFEARRLGYDN